MNDHDTTPYGAGPNVHAPVNRSPMTDTATTTNDAAPAAGATCKTPDGAPHPCADDCRHDQCHAGWFAKTPRADGRTYCCVLHGWLTPYDAFEASWDAYSEPYGS